MEEFVTLNQLKAINRKQCPPIQYVEILPSEVENGFYCIEHKETETKTVTTRFTDVLSTFFTEVTKGKWVINDTYSTSIDGKDFQSVSITGNNVSIYKNSDFSGLYGDTFLIYNTYDFDISEEIEHKDYYAGDKEKKEYVKIANEAEVQKYFVHINEKGKPNGVASLDSSGHIPIEQLPIETFIYKGTWDASTGVFPPNGDRTGEFYYINVEGTIEETEYLVGDWLVWDGTKWTKQENQNYVLSVNNQRGRAQVYGDNTEIETPSDTSDTRTIKEYIDDIKVDGLSKEDDNYTSVAVLEVTELPEEKKDKVYNVTKDENTEVYSKDVKLVTAQEDKNNIKKVNDETPDENGEVVVDGDNINVVYKEEEMTLNEALEATGTVKTVDGIEPDENSNVQSKAVVEVEEAVETPEDKVYNLKSVDEEGKAHYNVFSKDVEVATKEQLDELEESTVKSVNTLTPDEDGDVQTVIELTKAEYDALVEADEDDPNVIYAVIDENSSVDVINDFQVAEDLTWSSSKIKSVVEAATPIVFDNSKVSETMGWTSSKITEELGKSTSIDDTTTSTTTTWSSNKTNTTINDVDSELRKWTSETFEPVNSDLATKTWVGEQDYLTKTEAATTYEPKNDDLMTKTEFTNNFLTELKKYIVIDGTEVTFNF